MGLHATTAGVVRWEQSVLWCNGAWGYAGTVAGVMGLRFRRTMVRSTWHTALLHCLVLSLL